MTKEGLALMGPEGSECESDDGLEVFTGTGSGLTQVCFKPGKGHLEGIEVRAV